MGARFFQNFLLFAIGASAIALINPGHDIVQAALLSGSLMLPIFLAGESTISLARGYLKDSWSKLSQTELFFSMALMFLLWFIFYALTYRWIFVVALHLMK
ncbi:MAG TPA: hypothetical protein VF837_03140 [Patescibacteria group bacterium]